jgi:SlyX protein
MEACFAVNVQRLEQIETKLAFLERANAELSEVVFRQHREIETLRAQMVALAARVEAVQSDTRTLMPEEERPPHY